MIYMPLDGHPQGCEEASSQILMCIYRPVDQKYMARKVGRRAHHPTIPHIWNVM